MSSNEQEKLREYWIPENVLQGKRLFNMRLRNVIEAAIWAVIMIAVVSLIPFVTRVRIIVTVCLVIAAVWVNLLGVKDMTLSEVVLNYIHYRRTGQIYHLRSIDYAKKQRKNAAGKIATEANENNADRLIRFVKGKLEEFAEDDDDSDGKSEGSGTQFKNSED